MKKLKVSLHEKVKGSSSTSEYRLSCICIDVANHRLFGLPCIIDECELKKPQIPSTQLLQQMKKWIDAVNINKILSYKNVQLCILSHFKMKATPCISYIYRYMYNCIQRI
jgi:hypothetical protein